MENVSAAGRVMYFDSEGWKAHDFAADHPNAAHATACYRNRTGSETCHPLQLIFRATRPHVVVRALGRENDVIRPRDETLHICRRATIGIQDGW